MPTNKKYIKDVDYVIDTTLYLEHLDIELPDISIDSNQSEVLLPTHVINIIKSEIDDLLERQEISPQFPIHINLVDDSVWIAKGSFDFQEDEIVFDRIVYLEIRKKDGYILKRVIEE